MRRGYVSPLSALAPAKINLFLAITGRRPDGFHNLVSVVAPLAFGDELRFVPEEREGFRLQCLQAEVPLGEDNLILRAAKRYRECLGRPLGGVFHLEKQIPIGAGLGGGSSDASTALLLLDQHCAKALGNSTLESLAAELGSDCPLFLRRQALIMRGRGELLEGLDEETRLRLSGQRILLFKPSFGVSTPWAYKQMACASTPPYLPESEAEEKLRHWRKHLHLPLASLLYNNMQTEVFRKYIALASLLEELSAVETITPLMSGSGSCCFCVLPEGYDSDPLIRQIRAAWGEAAFVQETKTL